VFSFIRHNILKRTSQPTKGSEKLKKPGKKAELAKLIRKRIPSLKVTTILDVGANRGQTVELFRPSFPDAIIHCFEPVPAAFAILERVIAQHANTHVHNVALSSAPGTVTMSANGPSTTNRILPGPNDNVSTEQVSAERGDDLCTRLQLPRVSILKIDTEGHDLDVLKGFSTMLEASAIDIVQVEVGMNPTAIGLVPYQEVVSLMAGYDYLVFDLIDRVPHKRGRPVLQRCNAVFCSKAFKN
jgi:FkbM family methyltransferase